MHHIDIHQVHNFLYRIKDSVSFINLKNNLILNLQKGKMLLVRFEPRTFNLVTYWSSSDFVERIATCLQIDFHLSFSFAELFNPHACLSDMKGGWSRQSFIPNNYPIWTRGSFIGSKVAVKAFQVNNIWSHFIYWLCFINFRMVIWYGERRR